MDARNRFQIFMTDTTPNVEIDGMDDVVLPIQSVDPNEDLTERLTDNVLHQIGPARYFRKDDDGEPIEDWDGVFERVAKNVAIAEVVFHDTPLSVSPDHLADWVDEDTIDSLFFKPNHPSRNNPDPDTRAEYRELDEELAPYLEYDALRERAPDEIVDAMDTAREDFESAMREQRFMPNSPTLMNAGTEIQQLSACFVLEPGDSMTSDDDEEMRKSIMSTAKDAADIFKSGGGVGYAFHLLRPKGARIGSTSGVSSGPMSFMEIFDTVCGTVKQGGRRRGAQMGLMHVQHPDIGRFCVSKRGEEELTNFNISVGITDEFRDAVENDEEFTLVDPRGGWDEPKSFEVVPETAHFYDPKFEDAWNDDFDKPAVGYDGKVVETNFWRDYLDKMKNPEAFEQYRDQINLEPGDEMTLPAGFIYQLLIDGAHNKGEPGFVYLDEANREHSFDPSDEANEPLHATNPCAEQPLLNYEACNLGHVNLSLMLDEDTKPYDEWLSANFPDFEEFANGDHIDQYLDHALDQELFADTIETGTQFLDNVVTQSKFPLEEIEEQVHGKRKIGLGLMGFHQMLLQMGIQYGSPESYDVAEEIMRRIDQTSTEFSHQLAGQRGTFEEYEESKWASPADYPHWFRKHGHNGPEEHADGYPVRNHNMTTIAPTGTTSMLGDTTGGCEPIYEVAYFKNVSDDVQGDEMLVEFDDYFLNVLEANGIDVDAVREEAESKMMDDKFDNVDDLDLVPQEIADLFVTTSGLDVEQHIRVQAAFQNYCDSSISKTLNVRNDASIEEVGEAVELALDLGIKGATIYRIGSRQEEVKTTSSTGGGLTVPEAGEEELIDEILSRIDEDEDVRTQLMSELDLVQNTVEGEEKVLA